MSRALSFHPLKEKKAVDGRKHGARWCASKPPGSTWRLAGRVVAQCALVRQQTAGINPAARGKGCRTVRAGAPANRRDQSGGSREGLSHGARWCASKPPGSIRRLAGRVVARCALVRQQTAGINPAARWWGCHIELGESAPSWCREAEVRPGCRGCPRRWEMPGV
jgi:hypothetical protein